MRQSFREPTFSYFYTFARFIVYELIIIAFVMFCYHLMIAGLGFYEETITNIYPFNP